MYLRNLLAIGSILRILLIYKAAHMLFNIRKVFTGIFNHTLSIMCRFEQPRVLLFLSNLLSLVAKSILKKLIILNLWIHLLWVKCTFLSKFTLVHFSKWEGLTYILNVLCLDILKLSFLFLLNFSWIDISFIILVDYRWRLT